MGGEQTARDCVGYSDLIVWALIYRKNRKRLLMMMMVLFIDEWDYFELFLVMTFQEQPHTFLHRRSGFFSIVDGTSTVKNEIHIKVPFI